MNTKTIAKESLGDNAFIQLAPIYGPKKAKFIVKAVNSHYMLLEACKELRRRVIALNGYVETSEMGNTDILAIEEADRAIEKAEA